MLNWLSKGQKSRLPEPTALQELRAKQIEQLRLLNGSIAEIQRDVEYRVNVNDVLSLYILLPPQFPQAKPVLQVSPGIVHPWVNDQMLVTGCGALNNFKAHSDLGKVVKEIVDEFRQNPPALAATSVYPDHNIAMPSVPTTQSLHASAFERPPMYSTVAGNIDCAIFSDSIPALKDLSTAEINSLMDNEEKIFKMLEPNTLALANHREQLLQSIEASARENIAKQVQLEEKKRIILESHEMLNSMRHRLDELLRLQDERRKRYELSLIVDNMKVASMQADEEAEGCAEEFLGGNMSVEEFRKKYMTSRVNYHERRAMEDKISQLN